MLKRLSSDNISQAKVSGRDRGIKKYYKLNHQIQAKEVRVLDEEGKQLDVMPLSEALTKAQKLGLDLVEIAPEANPPVAKIIDYKKFKYLEEKKEKEARKKTK